VEDALKFTKGVKKVKILISDVHRRVDPAEGTALEGENALLVGQLVRLSLLPSRIVHLDGLARPPPKPIVGAAQTQPTSPHALVGVLLSENCGYSSYL
jgi:hypothetical protein